MPILCGPADDAEQLIRSIGAEVRVAETLNAAAKMMDDDPGETLAVIGTGVATEEALAFASAMRIVRPAVGVILVREQVDVTVLNRALQSGVREVVPAGDHAALAAACRRSRDVSWRVLASTAEPGGPAADGKVVTVFASKGGVGKTMLSVNLGVTLARAGNRVCVVDLDLPAGDVALSVLLDPGRTLADGVPMAGHLDVTGATSLLTSYQPGLDMLLAPVAPSEAEKIPPSLIGELLAVLRGMFDYVVADTAPQFSEHVLTALDAAAYHVLLTTPDVLALKGLRVTLDVLDMLSYPADIRSVVLNRANPKAHLTAKDAELALRTEVAAQIPDSHTVQNSINNGMPITLASPGHPVSKAITRFAQQHLLPPPASRGGLLSSLTRRQA
jgi:MinD-like ATPase involved in chromosome partitioning or flagellar assembly